MNRVLIFLFAIAAALPLRAAGVEKPAVQEETKSDSARAASSNDYLLTPQDVIRIQIFQEPDLGRELPISAEGVVELPLIGRVELKGKTVRQAEEMIRKMYDADYLVDPQVNLTVLTYAPRTIEVFGAVGNPGVITFPKEEMLTLTKAISLAGSFNRLANQRMVKLTRKMPDGSTKTFGPINVQDIIARNKGDNDADNMPLIPGDVIFVPEKII